MFSLSVLLLLAQVFAPPTLESQHNWRLDERGLPIAGTERTKLFRYESRNGQRVKVQVAQDGYALDAAEQALSARPADRTPTLQKLDSPARCYFETRNPTGDLLEEGYELLAPEKGLEAGSRVTYRYSEGALVELEVLFRTLLPSGETYRGKQLIRFAAAD